MPNRPKSVVYNNIKYPLVKSFCENFGTRRENETEWNFCNRILIKHFPEIRKKRNEVSRRCMSIKNQFDILRKIDVF